ncbi:hypothetical protein ABMA28_011108 [Loxostege sticticalis]|uniref:Uncharacterized protein n=1 Tax=Loxostege sticticalis TaxID=481309 RepID=A0ABD0S677_LOXSC
MAAKIIVVCAVALFAQAAFAQYSIGSGSYVSGNSVVDNDIIIGGGSGYGLGNGLALGTSGLALGSGSGYALGGGSAGVALGSGLGYSSGLGLSNGLGLSSGLGLSNGLGFSNNLGTIGVSAPSFGVGGLSTLNVAGSPLAITAISPIGPSGLAVASENVIEGVLTVTGQLPFLSAVAFEGALPTAGSGVATCGCGSGQVGIVSEGFGRPQIYY